MRYQSNLVLFAGRGVQHGASAVRACMGIWVMQDQGSCWWMNASQVLLIIPVVQAAVDALVGVRNDAIQACDRLLTAGSAPVQETVGCD